MFRGRLCRAAAVVALLAITCSLLPLLASTAGAAPNGDEPSAVQPLDAPTPPPIAPTPACTLTWVGGTGDWNFSQQVGPVTVTNWTPPDINGNGRIPGPADVACLPAGNYTVTKSSGIGVNGLLIGDANPVAQPKLVLTATLGASITKNYGTFEFGNGAGFFVAGSLGTNIFENFADWNVTGSSSMSCGDVHNMSRWHVTGTGSMNFGGCSPRVITSTGDIDIDSGGSLSFDGTNGGSDIRLIGGTVTVSGSGQFVSQRDIRAGGGLVVDAGPIRQDRGFFEFFGPMTGKVLLTATIGGGGNPAVFGNIPLGVEVNVQSGFSTGSPVENQGTIILGNPNPNSDVRIDAVGANTFTNKGTMLFQTGGGTGIRGFNGDAVVTNASNASITFTSPEVNITNTFVSSGNFAVLTENSGAIVGAVGMYGPTTFNGGNIMNNGSLIHRGSNATLSNNLIITGNPFRKDRGFLTFSGNVTGPVMTSGRIGGGGNPFIGGTISGGVDLTVLDSLETFGGPVINNGDIVVADALTTDGRIWANGANTFTNQGTLLFQTGGGTGIRGFLGDAAITNTGTLTFTTPEGSINNSNFTNVGAFTVGTENGGAIVGGVGVSGTSTWSGTVTNNGVLIAGGGTTSIGATNGLTITGNPFRKDRGVLNFTGAVAGPVMTSARIGGGGNPFISGTISSGVDLTVADSVETTGGPVVNNGDIVVGDAQTTDGRIWENNGNTFTNNGTLSFPNVGTGVRGFNGDAQVTNSATGSITFAAPQGNNNAPLTNAGTFTIPVGGGIGSSPISQTGGSFVVNGGLGTTLNVTGGTVMGTGHIDGTVNNTSGTVAAGNSPGTLTINGTYTQGAAGTLAVEINGKTAGQFDLLDVNGTANLDGTIAVTSSTLADPGVTVLTADTRNGTFSNQTGVLPNDVTYPGNNVVVRVQSAFRPLQPARILDSRDGTGGFNTPWGPATTRDLQVSGQGGVPATATAVVMNVTVTGPTSASHLTIWPKGAATPATSNLNFSAGQTIPNLVTVKLGTDGKVSIFNNAGNVQVIADVVGYYDGNGQGDALTGVTPARVLDSRDGTGGYSTPWGGGVSRDVTVAGTGPVPANATAVVLNVTAVGPTAASHLTVWPAGTLMPVASNLNFPAGRTIPNLVVVPVGTGGKISIFNNAGNVNILADVVGYYSTNATSGHFTGIDPVRLVDSRDGTGTTAAPWGPGETRAVTVAGVSSIPADATAVVLNVTGVSPTTFTHITVFPNGASMPVASNLNLRPGDVQPNAVLVKVGDLDKISLFNNAGNTNIIVDVVGYFT